MNADSLRDLLQRVIDERKAEGLDASYRILQELVEGEERSTPRGLALNRTTASQIVKGTYKGVASPGTIRAIAWLAGVPEADAFIAAGQKPPGPPFAEELPPGVDDLSPKERRAAIEVLRTFVAMRREIDRYESETAIQGSTQSGTSGEAQSEIEEVKPSGLNDPEQGRRLDDARAPEDLDGPEAGSDELGDALSDLAGRLDVDEGLDEHG